MRWQEILNRLTGLSTPFFGLSWNPPESDVTVARRVMTHLEDRRVLYAPHELEVPWHCARSVIDVRAFLTDALSTLGEQSTLAMHLRAMRAACRKFLYSVQDDHGRILVHGMQPRHYESWTFLPAIGELRGVFGIHLAQIAAKYGLDVEDELASILPGEDAGDGIRCPDLR